MFSALFVLLFLCAVNGNQDQLTPDLHSMITKLQSQVQTLQTEVQSLQSQKQNQDIQTNVQSGQTQQQNDQQVAFLAGLRSDDESIAAHSIPTVLKYRRAVMNIGNGYNSDTGVFTAPVSGLYVFFVMLNAEVLHSDHFPILKKNTEFLATLSPSTMVTMATLRAGDAVFVEQKAGVNFRARISTLNSFSGFRLANI